MNVTNDRRRELAAKVRDVMGELTTIELDGIPLADLIEPEECDGCEPGDWEVVAMDERPDSWERLEEDARQLDIDLNDTTDDYPRMSCCRDLVRRAKTLAERGQ